MNLRIPGPVPLPEEVLEITGRQMINHRGPEFAEIIDRMTTNFKKVLGTQGRAYFLTASGTGSMEAAVVNTLSPGDRVLSVSIGSFGNRFGDIAEAYGAEVTRIEFEWGTAADPEKVRETIRSMPDCAAVVVTHNESSTGVMNPIEAIARAVHDESDALVLVDAVSSAAGVPLPMDDWGLDVVGTASQKSWVAPPGIAMVAMSDQAWKAHETSTIPKYYFDIDQYEKFLQMGQPPFTPALSTIYALDHSLQAIVTEGIEEVLIRHAARAQQTRDGAKRIGLEIFPEESIASDTVTAISVPADIDGKALVSHAREVYNVELGGGQEKLAGQIIRIGHMGWVLPEHIDESIDAVEKTLADLRS
ncbi:MAG: alanine--glyoxylate aminotransferase family protein [Chloroflexi bacterium]|nr:alanine--glyoxylate aminotransferase family protein [Chloroflexota bacterium]MBT4074070.1 alanine--glyoxylate aminotransferase family protein [Chloroflexota bacterium]MBT6681871.1 alanine--glyoxylate aminotransferase family protein [Chloroflexota bacterium]